MQLMKMPMRVFLFGFSLFAIAAAASPPGKPYPPFPRVWTSYSTVVDFETDFRDLEAHGVDAIEAGAPRANASEMLAAARKHGIRFTTRVGEGVGMGELPPDAPERPVMIGGAYEGRAIDRFRFKFSPARQQIVIERPMYHKENVYGTNGHYHIGLTQPCRAEVIVKQRDFDGKPHFQVFDARMTPLDENHWTMSFNLTGATGDLDNVILGVYWRAQGKMHRAPDLPAMRSSYTKTKLAAAVRNMVKGWRDANGGTFPSDVVFAVRFGDENWHTSSHVSTSPEVSYPLWDYSDSAVAAFEKAYPDLPVPRGKNWIDVFGLEAYAAWMRCYHESAAELVRLVKQTLREEGVGNLLVFRNITRSDVFSAMNDHDGTGLELLVREFDIVHLDPYPVTARGYREGIIPVDMSYLAGLARRYKKYLVPWVQAHTYFPQGYFGLVHPSPEDIDRMMADFRPHAIDGFVWLGYSKSNTFPLGRPDSWEAAARVHQAFFEGEAKVPKADLAVVRPYTVRALRDEERNRPQDRFFTDSVLWDVVMRQKRAYDPFEPLDSADLDPKLLSPYSMILAEVGSLAPKSIQPLVDARRKSILFIEGVDNQTLVSKLTGVLRCLQRGFRGDIKTSDGQTLAGESADLYTLAPHAKVLARAGGQPCVWAVGRTIFVAVRGKERDDQLPAWLWEAAKTL